MSGNGPVARDLVAQAGSLRTLLVVGDRRVADMATARADAVDAAPAGSVSRALREDLTSGSAVREKSGSSDLSKRKPEMMEEYDTGCNLEVTFTREGETTAEIEKSTQVRASVRRCRRRTEPLALQEPTLSWHEDLNVKPEELAGVKKLFEVLLQIEVSHGRISRKEIVPSTTSHTPPRRWADLATTAVNSYRRFATAEQPAMGMTCEADLADGAIPASMGGTNPHDPPPMTVPERADRGDEVLAGPDASSAETSEEDSEDELKISFIMQEALVWKPVRSSYNSDLSMRMLSLKSEVSEGSFSQKRSQILRDGVCVQVHRYRRSQDTLLAHQALAETQHIYERRVRDLLTEAFDLADMPNHELARRLASSISRKLVLDPAL